MSGRGMFTNMATSILTMLAALLGALGVWCLLAKPRRMGWWGRRTIAAVAIGLGAGAAWVALDPVGRVIEYGPRRVVIGLVASVPMERFAAGTVGASRLVSPGLDRAEADQLVEAAAERLRRRPGDEGAVVELLCNAAYFAERPDERRRWVAGWAGRSADVGDDGTPRGWRLWMAPSAWSMVLASAARLEDKYTLIAALAQVHERLGPAERQAVVGEADWLEAARAVDAAETVAVQPGGTLPRGEVRRLLYAFVTPLDRTRPALVAWCVNRMLSNQEAGAREVVHGYSFRSIVPGYVATNSGMLQRNLQGVTARRDPLADRLAHASPAVRQFACEEAWRIGADAGRVLVTLKSLARKDPDEIVRKAAYEAEKRIEAETVGGIFKR